MLQSRVTRYIYHDHQIVLLSLMYVEDAVVRVGQHTNAIYVVQICTHFVVVELETKGMDRSYDVESVINNEHIIQKGQ